MKRVIASFARVFLRKRIVKFDSGKMFFKKSEGYLKRCSVKGQNLKKRKYKSI